MNGVHQEILVEENTHVCMHTHIYTHTIVYRIHICTNEIVPFAWIELQIIVLNEIIQAQEDKVHIFCQYVEFTFKYK